MSASRPMPPPPATPAPWMRLLNLWPYVLLAISGIGTAYMLWSRAWH